MTSPLSSTLNTPQVERRIRRAFRQIHRSSASRRPFQTVYEHGHWWVIEDGPDDTLQTWDAVDADGGDSFDGFNFEEV